MATSEIEKLERRYAENPHGLTFAPLAEVHRKNGDVARALELLTAGLELHPNYIPASIVLGRCHQDLGDLPSAEAAFAHVLRLDDENVIALKSLADINERLERFGDAETWLRRLVSVDRSNDEAREQLQRIETTRQGETKSDAAPVAPAAVQGETKSDAEPAAPTPVLEMIDLTAETVAESPEPASSPAEPLPVDIVDIAAVDLKRPPSEKPPSEEVGAVAEKQGNEPDEPGGQEETVQPLPGLISAEFQPPLEAIGGLGVETSDEVVLEASGNTEFRVPDASEDLKFLAARLNPPPPPPAERRVAERRAERRPESAPAAEPAPSRPTEPEFTVTEAMAEVLVQQGHSADALKVYRELARRNGGDSRLHSRIQELEAAARDRAEPPSYVAAVTKGQSVAAFFHALVTAQPPGPGPAGGPPASHSKGGEQDRSNPGDESTAARPALLAGEQKADAAVSFDDFFNSEASESNPLDRASDPGEDDLDQFQSWLQNLKR